jgi:hypothetical protein
MPGTGTTAGVVRRRLAGTRPAHAALTVAAMVALTSAFGWVMALLFSDPDGVVHDPVRGYLFCVQFAALATAVCVIALGARGKPLSPVLVVCSLAMWSLLPVTVFLSFWAARLYAVFVIAVMCPLVLACAAWAVALRGRPARGTGLLLVALFVTAGGTAIGIPGLPTAAWLPVELWQLVLAVAVIGALRWDMRRGRG